MKDYILLLRGINISGKNKVSMPLLQEKLTHLGYKNVLTYLNSGNIPFSSSLNLLKIQDMITTLLYEEFGLLIPMIIIEKCIMEDYLTHLPSWFNQGNQEYIDQMIFVLGDLNANEIYNRIGAPNLENEQIEVYKHMLFWTLPKANYQKSKWWKQTALDPIAKNVTIRKVSTIIHLLDLMNQ